MHYDVFFLPFQNGFPKSDMCIIEVIGIKCVHDLTDFQSFILTVTFPQALGQ